MAKPNFPEDRPPIEKFIRDSKEPVKEVKNATYQQFISKFKEIYPNIRVEDITALVYVAKDKYDLDNKLQTIGFNIICVVDLQDQKTPKFLKDLLRNKTVVVFYKGSGYAQESYVFTRAMIDAFIKNLDNINKELSCPICCKKLTYEIEQFLCSKCSYIICGDCFDKILVAKDIVRCPQCRNLAKIIPLAKKK